MWPLPDVHVLTLRFVQEEAGGSQQGGQRRQYDGGHACRWLHRPLHQEPLPRPEGRQTLLSVPQGPGRGHRLGSLGATQLRVDRPGSGEWLGK